VDCRVVIEEDKDEIPEDAKMDTELGSLPQASDTGSTVI
jgi:hypothetical protein